MCDTYDIENYVRKWMSAFFQVLSHIWKFEHFDNTSDEHWIK